MQVKKNKTNKPVKHLPVKGSKQVKKRVDQWLVELGLVETREKAKALVMAGQVLAATRRVDKPGEAFGVEQAASLSIKAGLPYVSRGGLKLEKALDLFKIDPVGKLALDIGASTGGFTDCLLQRGTRLVYAVDVGHSQLNWRLQTDPRVVVLDKTNIRYLQNLPPQAEGEAPPQAELVVIDVSFISLKLVLPAARRLSSPGSPVVALVKPQFEAGKDQVGKGGIIKDPSIHRAVLKDLIEWCNSHQFLLSDLIRSPILGTEGNTEFLAYLKVQEESGSDQQEKMLALINPLFEEESSSV